MKKRPKEVYKHENLKHWEADTVKSGRTNRQRKGSKYCFVTLVGRKSRYCIVALLPNRKEEHMC